MDVTGFIERLDAAVKRDSLSLLTKRQYARNIRLFAEWSGLKSTDGEPTPEQLETYAEHLAYDRQLTNKTIRVHLAPVIRYARYMGIFDAELERVWNQLRTDYKPKPQETPSYLSEETVEEIKTEAKPDSTAVLEEMPETSRETLSEEELAFLDDNAPGDEREYAIICLLESTGIRIGELCNLTLADVDLSNGGVDGGTASVERQKRKEEVIDTIPFPEETASAVDMYIDVRDEYFVDSTPDGLGQRDGAQYPPTESESLFVTSSWSTNAHERFGDGWALSPQWCRRLISSVASRADVEIKDDSISSIYPHLFRHTAASRLAQSGFSNVEIAGWLGVEPSTADIYADISDDEMTAMADAINKS
jgi:integrase